MNILKFFGIIKDVKISDLETQTLLDNLSKNIRNLENYGGLNKAWENENGKGFKYYESIVDILEELCGRNVSTYRSAFDLTKKHFSNFTY